MMKRGGMQMGSSQQNQTNFTETTPSSMIRSTGSSLSFPENQSHSCFSDPNVSFGKDPHSSFYSDQTPDSSFSRLSLSSPPYHHQRQPSFHESDLDTLFIDSIFNKDYLVAYFNERDQNGLNSDGFRVLETGNSQMGGFGGGAHGNLMVGSQSWVGVTPSSNTMAAGDNVSSCSEVNPMNDELGFLQRKKPLPKLFGAQVPKFPSLNRDGFHNQFTGFNDEMQNSCSINLDQLSQIFKLVSLEELRGKIVALAKDPCGCRILQMRFGQPKEDDIEIVLSEVIDHVVDLMKNQFGNHLIQKLVAICNEEQRTLIILSLTKTLFQLIGTCLNPHGARAVQKLLEHIDNSKQISLVISALSPGAVALSLDPFGHQVIQYCLLHFTTEDNKLLLNKLADNALVVAADRSGCNVIQSSLKHSQGELREHLVAEIIANAVHLAEHPYGNYVVQRLLVLKIPEVTTDLLRQLEGSYASLSCNKYASNVVERCLSDSGEQHSTRIIVELITSPNSSMLLIDPFANFVIQAALSASTGLVHIALLNLVRVHASSLRNNHYGKKVLAWLEKKKPHA